MKQSVQHLPATTLCHTGVSKDAALASATDALPAGAQLMAAHWIHIPGHTDPALRWLVVLAYIATDQRASLALTRELVTRL